MEIHAGEGGDDSKDFVHELASVYIKYASKLGLACVFELTELGHVILKVSGLNAEKAFENESGKHVVQRVPSSGHGKKHTSVVSVAILPLPQVKTTQLLPEKDLDIKAQCGGGPGGQAINKTASTVRIKHKPTGEQVVIQNGRSQEQNKLLALRILSARIYDRQFAKVSSDYNTRRREQLGGGNRGDKTRTYNFMESRVVDHRLGVKTNNIKAIMKGELGLLFKSPEKETE